MAAPWKQTVTLSWRPALRFYEERLGVLRRFEDAGILRAFRVDEDYVDAQLYYGDIRLSVRQDGATLHILRPDADADKAWAALRIAVEGVGVRTFTRVRCELMYVDEVPATDFRAAMTSAQQRLFRPRPLESELRLGDWSVLQDIHAHDDDRRDGVIEFGVVQASEVPGRLAGTIGRGAGERLSPVIWEEAVFPAVALFADLAMWTRAETPSLDEAAEYWHKTRSETGSLISSLQSSLFGDQEAERKDEQ